jgi:hypothetical protein
MRKMLRAAVLATLTAAAIMSVAGFTPTAASAHPARIACWNGTNWDGAC